MRTYRISPSLMNKFSEWLNCADTYAKYWGNMEAPEVTEAEFEKVTLRELFSYINREPQPLSEAANRGTCLNEIVDCLIGAYPNPSVSWEKVDGRYIAQRNGFTFNFDARMVEDLQLQMRNSIPQYHLENTYELAGCDYSVTLHGYSDYIFPTQIWDLKTTSKYEAETYRDNWQRLVYPVVAVDSGDVLKCETFGFHVVECWKPKGVDVICGRTWRETYDVNVEEARGQIMEFITGVMVPTLDQWHAEGRTPNQNICNYDE